jgi:Plant transposon protein
MAEVGRSTVAPIFTQFVTGFARHFRKDFIYMPDDEDDLRRVLDIYTRLGFPGCIGSMDCTHIKWLTCPSALSNRCTGKEGYPTLGFQVLVDHLLMNGCQMLNNDRQNRKNH